MIWVRVWRGQSADERAFFAEVKTVKEKLKAAEAKLNGDAESYQALCSAEITSSDDSGAGPKYFRPPFASIAS